MSGGLPGNGHYIHDIRCRRLFDGRARLQWTTSDRGTSTGFAVEHRPESQLAFAEIGFVDSTPEPDEPSTYRFESTPLSPGTHHFRLRQTDPDGTLTYSPSVEVRVGVVGEFRIEEAYPNPFRGRTTIRIAVARTQRVQALVYDALGRLRYKAMDEVVSADQQRSVKIESPDLESGLYIVRISGESFSTDRLVIRLK